MKTRKKILFLFAVVIVAAFLRFYNLMHDAPYFFNPDEKNMAAAITRFKIPSNGREIPLCILSQFNLYPKPSSLNSASCHLNPQFFAYGQFPLYLAFLSDQLIKPILNILSSQTPIPNSPLTTSFPSAIFWLRFWSAFSSTLTVLLVFLVCQTILSFRNWKKYTEVFSIFAATFAAFTPGLIQAAHFGTTESVLTFFFLVSIYLSIRFVYLNHLSYLSHLKYILFLSFFVGLAIGTKLTGVFFLAPAIFSLTLRTSEILKNRLKKGKFMTEIFKYWAFCLFLTIGTIFFSILSSPYNLVDQQGFLGSVFGYESDVATGRYEAFYTRQFVGTIPILFQIKKIFPYALGWPVFIFGSLGFLFIIVQLISQIFLSIIGLKSKIKSQNCNLKLITLIFSFLIYLLPNSFLFAKWTRFMTPVFPFFSIFSSYFLFEIFIRLKTLIIKNQNLNIKYQKYISNTKNKKIFSFLQMFLLFVFYFLPLLPGLSFISIYAREDTRVASSKWIYQNIPNRSYILSETANVVDIPLDIPTVNQQPMTHNYKVISFDFYHLDQNATLQHELYEHLTRADYIFIPSRRIFANYLRLPQKYPLVNQYYSLLFSGRLGFEKVAEFTSYPTLLFFNSNLQPTTYNLQLFFTFPDENAEETFTVFDHPVVRIYKKVKPLSKEEYQSLMQTGKLSLQFQMTKTKEQITDN